MSTRVKCTDCLFYNLATKITHESLTIIAINLNVTKVEVQQIEKKHALDHKTQVLEVLRKWHEKEGEEATCHKLMEIYLKMENREAAELIENFATSNMGSIGEMSSAEEREDSSMNDCESDPHLTNEQRAIYIFRNHAKELRSLSRPIDVARFLKEEGVNINMEQMEDKDTFLNDRIGILIAGITTAIKENHEVLLKLGRICSITGNEELGHKIQKDCNAAFVDSDNSKACEVFSRTVQELEEMIRKSGDKILSHFKSFFRQQYCIEISTIEDCVTLIKRDTSQYSMASMEDFANELNCPRMQNRIAQYKQIVMEGAVPCAPQRSSSCLATMETLSISMNIAPDMHDTEIHHFLRSLFGRLFDDVVKWHHLEEDSIICYFHPMYATLLMKIIFEKYPLCKQKQVQGITVGYCSVYDEVIYDEAYRKLQEKVNELEMKNKELERDHEELKEELTQEINNLKEENVELKKKMCELQNNLDAAKEHIKILKNEEHKLQETLRDKDKVLRASLQENHFLTSLLHQTKGVEKELKESQNEVIQLGMKIQQLRQEREELEKIRMEKHQLQSALQNETELSSSLLRQLEERDRQKATLEMEGLKQMKILRGEKEALIREKEALMLRHLTVTERNHAQTQTVQESADHLQEGISAEYPQEENVHSTSTDIIITAPSPNTCRNIEIQQYSLSLTNAVGDSASILLNRLQNTTVEDLRIYRTYLSQDSIHSINGLLQKLSVLHLINVYLPPTALRLIFNTLTTNEQLKEFFIQFDNQMVLYVSSTSSTNRADSISDVIARNTTLTRLSLLGLRLDENGIMKIFKALVDHNTTIRLLSLDRSHRNTAYKFSETHGPIKDRLDFT